jgi:hypothetical protein
MRLSEIFQEIFSRRLGLGGAELLDNSLRRGKNQARLLF